MIQEWVLALRKRGKAVLFIHHAGKNGTQRGTSKREDILDSVLMLKRPRGYSPKDGARFEVHYEKARGFYGEEAEAFEAALTESESGQFIWRCGAIRANELEHVIALYKQGMTNQRNLSNATGISVGKVNTLLKRAKETELI